MPNKLVGVDKSMDEILEHVQREYAQQSIVEATPPADPPHSAEVVNLNPAGDVRNDRSHKGTPEAAPTSGPLLTLEDVIREMLRPILRVQLDEKLPIIIERLVKAELSRALSQAGLT